MEEYKKKIFNSLETNFNIHLNRNDSFKKTLTFLYKNGLTYDEIINHLLSLNDEQIEDDIWNNFYLFEDIKIAKTKKFKDLYDSYLIDKRNNFNSLALNKTNDIIGEDIILKKTDEHFAKIISTKYQGLEEFKEYSSEINNFHKNDRFCFIVIDKNSEDIVGFVGLYCSSYAFIETEKTYMNEYYIFPEYRHKHYATKALTLLTNAALNNQIIIYSDKKRRYHFMDTIEEIKIIYGLVRKDNLPSYKTQLASGYEHLGQICIIRNGHYMRDELFVKLKAGLE